MKRKLVMTLALVTLVINAAVARMVEWEFPRLDNCHEGMAFSDGMTGVLVWGGGDKVNFTIGRGDLWDHRGGYTWQASQNYTNIVALAQGGNLEALKRLFVKVTPEGEPRNPLLLPFGRIVVTIPGWELKHGALDPYTGFGELDFVGKQGECKALLAMSMAGGFVVKFPEDVKFTTVAIPSMEQPEAKAALSAISHKPPEKWTASEGNAGGFVWKLVNPADKSAAMTWTKQGGELAITTSRGESRAPAGTNYVQARKDSLMRWSAFWAEGCRVTLPDEKLQEMFEYGMYRFGAMTDPKGYPAGLQGQWLEDHKLIPWGGDYHFNINVQECYSPAFRGGHFDNLKPLFKMMLTWKPMLRENARKFVGIDDGYCLPHSVSDQGVNIGGFWTGTIDHGSTAWMASMMYRYVKYAEDFEFLKRDAFDFMKGAMNVYLAMLEEHNGRLSLPIGPSPEWKGSNPKLAIGRDPSFQLAAAHRLAEDLIEAANRLGLEPDARWLDLQKRLPRFTRYDYNGFAIFEGVRLDESHRHHSHMAGIYPFDSVPREENERVIRETYANWIGEGTGNWTGWCVPWAAILHVDAGNSVAAVHMLHAWRDFYNNPGHGSVHNPIYHGFSKLMHPFQIMQMDGQCAAATAVMELLAHERDGKVEFFRGCPEEWKEVSFENLALANGSRVDGMRKNGVITIKKHE